MDESELEKMLETFKGAIARIESTKDEILQAFIAKYGFEPDEAVIATKWEPNGLLWCIRKRLPGELEPKE